MRKYALSSLLLAVIVVFLCGTAFSAVSHKVRSGDTLQKLSKKYHVSIDKLKEANGLRSSALMPGQTLTIPGEATKSKAARNSNTKQKSAKKSKKIVPEDEPIVEENDEVAAYRVKKGDTLERIAARFGVDRQDIVDLNDIRKKRLSPGTTLYIPKVEEGGDDETIVLNESVHGRRPLKSWKNEEECGVLVKVAKSFAGAPYKYGGDSVRGLDCSAFVKKMYEIFDVQLPRSAREQFTVGMPVKKENLSTGDLVFFQTKRAKYPTHVGIYIGDGKFIHASSVLRRGVKVDSLSDGYFTRRYMGAVRVKDAPAAETSNAAPNQYAVNSNS